MYTPIARRATLLVRSRIKALVITLLAIAVTQSSVLLVGEPAAIAESMATAYSFLCLALPVIFVSGAVSADLRAGTVRLWLQKPVDPVVFYLGRFAEGISVALVFALLGLGATRLGIAALGEKLVPVGDLVDALPPILIVGVVAFGFSSWVPRGSTLATIAFLVAGSMAGATLPDLLGRPWNWLADAVLVPISALRDFRGFLLGTSDAVWIPVARILAYSIGWTALGALGVWHTVTKGRLPNAEQS